MPGNIQKSTIPPDSGQELFGFSDFEKRIKDLESQLADLTRGADGIDAPSLDCTPSGVGDPCNLCSCAIVSQRGAKDGGNRGIKPLIKYLIPENTYELVTAVIKCSDWDTANTDKHKKIIKGRLREDDITDDDRLSGHLTGEFSELLEEETDYYIIFLRVRNDGVTTSQTPPGDLVPGDGINPGQFLAKFTTKKIIPANPSLPSCADIVKNAPNLDDEISGNAEVIFEVQGDKDGLISIEDLDIDKVVIFLLPVPAKYPVKPIPVGTKSEQYKIEISRDNLIDPDDDPLAVAHFGLRIPISLPIGRHYIWYKTTLINVAGKSPTPLTYDVDGIPVIDPLKSCTFFAGGRVAGDDSEIPLPTIIAGDNLDSRNSEVSVTFTQPVSPILLQTAEIFISYDGGATDRIAGSLDLRTEEPNTSGVHTVKVSIKHKKNKEQATWLLQARLTGVGKFFDTVEMRIKHPRKDSATVPFIPFYGKPTANPSFGFAADITTIINTDTEQADAFVSATVKCYKSHLTDNTPMDGRDAGHSPAQLMAFKDAHVDEIDVVLAADSLGNTEKHHIKKILSTDPERAANTMVCTRVLPGLSDLLFWRRTKFVNGDGNTVTDFPVPVQINLGGVKRAQVIGDIPVPSFGTITQDGNRHATVNVLFTQTTPAILLSKIKIQISTDGGANWKKKTSETLKNDEDYHIAGQAYTVPMYMSHPANKNVLYRVRIKAAGGLETAFVTSGTITTPGDTSMSPLQIPSVPSLANVTANTIDGEPASGNARVRVKVNLPDTTAGKIFGNQNVKAAYAKFKTKTADTVDKLILGGPVNSGDTFAEFETYISIGTQLTWLKNVFENGDQTTEATPGSAVQFVTGLLIIFPADATTVTLPTFVSITNRNSKKDTVVVRAQQPTTGSMIQFKELVVEQDDGNGFEEVKRTDLTSAQNLYSGLNNDGVHGFQDIKFKVRRDAGSTAIYRAKQIAVGGKESAFTTSSTLGSTIGDIAPDVSAPTVGGVPILSWNSHGRLIIKNMFSTADIHTLKERYVVVKDAFGHYYDFSTDTITTTESTARLKIGLVDRYPFVHVKLAQIRSAFDSVTTPPYNIFGYYYDENDVNLTRSVDSSALLITDKTDVFGNRDAVSTLDINVFGGNYYQLFNNGDFLFYRNPANTNDLGGGWRRWDGTGVVSSNNRIAPASTGMTWDKANHKVKWVSNGQRLVYNMERRLLPGDYISVTVFMKSGGTISPSVSLKLIADDGSNTDETEVFANPTFFIDASGYKRATWTIRLSLTANAAVDHYLVWQTTFSINTTNDIELDRMMGVRGQMGIAYGSRPYFEVNGANANVSIVGTMGGDMVGFENPDNTPNSITQPDIFNPTGSPGTGGATPGGGFGPGTGGNVN